MLNLLCDPRTYRRYAWPHCHIISQPQTGTDIQSCPNAADIIFWCAWTALLLALSNNGPLPTMKLAAKTGGLDFKASMKTIIHAEACGFEWNCARRHAGANGPLSDEAGLEQLDLTACPRAHANPFSVFSPKRKLGLERWLAAWSGERSCVK